MEMNDILRIWYQQPIPYVALLAFLVAALLTLWVLYAASRRDVAATLWKALTLIGTLIILPSVILGVLPVLQLRYVNLLEPLAIMGILGAALAIVGVIGYAVAPGQPRGIAVDTLGTSDVVAVPSDTSEPPQATTPMEPPLPPGGFAPQRQVSGGTVILKKEPATLAWLVVRSGPHTNKDFRLGQVSKIGRDPTLCQVVLDDEAVSREHASIRLVDDGEFYITDLDSSNGTFVNDERVYRQRLANGDTLKVGETNLVFMCLAEKKSRAAD